MSLPIQISSYPVQFQEIAQRFNRDRTPLEVPCVTMKAAQRLRFRLYGFKKALRSANMDEMLGTFLSTEILVQSGPSPHREVRLVIRMPEDDSALRAIEAAIGGSAPSGEKTVPFEKADFDVQGTVTGRFSSEEVGEVSVAQRKDQAEDSISSYLKAGGAARLAIRNAPQGRLAYCEEHGLTEPCPICKVVQQ